MGILLDVLKVIHIVTAILMAWPFYALVAVNERARLGPPLGDRTDAYMESFIKGRTIPCFVFQATALITGLALILIRGLGMDALIARPVLGIKLLLLLLIAGLLAFVHLSLQPRIDALFAGEEGTITGEAASSIAALRGRRKRIASVCLFGVLTIAMLGVQAWTAFPIWLSGVFVLAIVLFIWRTFYSGAPYGWA